MRHPNITVELVGTDGNAYAVLGKVQRALRDAGVPEAEVQTYVAEATSGDYDQLLQTTMRWVGVA